MKLLIRILITTVLVMVIAHFMRGSITLAHGFETSIKVAIVLALLNFFVKPLLVLLTLPITFITLGLFLLVINAVIILLCAHFVTGFGVHSFWTALIFSVILSLLQSVVYQLTGEAN